MSIECLSKRECGYRQVGQLINLKQGGSRYWGVFGCARGDAIAVSNLKTQVLGATVPVRTYLHTNSCSNDLEAAFSANLTGHASSDSM